MGLESDIICEQQILSTNIDDIEGALLLAINDMATNDDYKAAIDAIQYIQDNYTLTENTRYEKFEEIHIIINGLQEQNDKDEAYHALMLLIDDES